MHCLLFSTLINPTLSQQQSDTMTDVKSKNGKYPHRLHSFLPIILKKPISLANHWITIVYGKPLHIHSTSPMTGFLRDGFCHTGPKDPGDHSIAATVTTKFLEFSAAQGNDLRPIGLTEGSKWCLCSGRWKEAMEAAKNGKLSKEAVPKVHLHATNESALKNGLTLEGLKEYAATEETGNAGRPTPQSRHGGLKGAVNDKDQKDLVNKEEHSSRHRVPGEL